MSSGCGDVLSLADLQTAKKHQIFEAEVITGLQGGIAGGTPIDYATNQVTGQVQKTLPAVLRDAGFFPASWDFAAGGTLTESDRNKVVYDPVSQTWYSYAGTLPVTVPAGFNPVGSADWKPQTDPTVRTDLASTNGFDMVGAPVGGTLRTVIQYVTPEQYGAIGDGTLHPLSERFASLAAAQAVYPFVTSLTQSIDWAACQKAENENRGVRPIRCPFYAKYHLGNDYLKLGEKSKWYGNDMPSLDRDCTTFIREGNSGTFGQNCIVRVMTAAEAGSTDEFVRGIVFKGFRLTRNRPRRYNSKYEGSIGFHADHAIGMQVNVSVNGCEYGFLGYVCWNLSGNIRIDSCHKGIWLDPATATPEYTPAAGAAMTALDLRVEVDACVFGLVLRRCKYGKLSGWVEGMIVNPSVYPIYDTANETAIAVTTYNCDSLDITQLGIEAWQGVHVYNYGGSASINESWTPDYAIVNTTGKHGPYHAMSVLMANTELFTLPATANSMFYNLNVGSLTVRNLSGDFSNATTYGSVYFLTTDQTSRIVFENCAVYFGSNAARFAPGWLGNVETVGGRYIEDAITPNGYKKIGPNYFVKTTWSTKAISAGDGRVQIAVGTDTPLNLKLHDVQAYVVASTTSQPLPIAQVSASDTAIIFQTAVTTAAFSINWKAHVSWTA
ncbi:tailspike 63D sialidase [Escherichia phage ZCEC5]|uniref:tailspike 63D sialidase n=1 Tax=Escherichia phage ZCEC5 TaxID=2530021 RepID=UPI0010B3263B|nr:tailspike 63D sialidase [Escherichia phage ZCEC5]QBJ02991.1 tailspike 63D sialidase [Escherichia phage ZCEC5]